MTDQGMEKWKKRLRNMKKEDYIVLLLIGVLLLIISLPTKKEETVERNRKDFWSGEKSGETTEPPVTEEETVHESGNSNNNNSYDLETYVKNLERRVEELISGMEGAGKVRVMITVSDTGTEILERNKEITTGNLEETDNAGGSRKNAENTQREEVIYRRDANGNETPYVVQRKLPEVTGVVVTAEGAGNVRVKENIIGAVSVLFNLNEHRIKVIRMKS